MMRIYATMIAVMTLCAAGAWAQVGDDFDPGGLDPLSFTVNPDNSGNNGAFPSSSFDVFGVTDRTVNFDFADDSLNIFPADTFGVLKEGKTDKVFGVEDVENADNPNGTFGTATWTFDVSSFTDGFKVSIDFAAMGNFEGTDQFSFSGSIDGGSDFGIFTSSVDTSANLDYTLESGTVVNLIDPLSIEVNGVATQLNNDFQTIDSLAIAPATTFTLNFNAEQNGPEVFVFDNILITDEDAMGGGLGSTGGSGGGGGGGGVADPMALILKGLVDGGLELDGDGGDPKAIVLEALADIPDLSIWGLGVANNGGGSDGQEYNFPAVSLMAGDIIVVTPDASHATFLTDNFPDIAATFEDFIAGINGDDPVELYLNDVVVDTYGDVAFDGSGTPWEYTDSVAYRISKLNDPFALEDWVILSPGTLAGLSGPETAGELGPVFDEFANVVPEPATAGLLGLAGLALLRRRRRV